MSSRISRHLLCLALVFTCLLILPATLLAQTTRVLIVGDSWAQQQFVDQVHEAVFDVNGFPDIIADGTTTAISGSEAADWVMPDQLQVIDDALDFWPDVDTVQLTIGGNDFLNAWTADMTPMEEMALQQSIGNDINTIIDFILNHDPNLEIILSFYDYPNFVDTLTGLSGIFCSPLHNDMAQPTAEELNLALQRFEAEFAAAATSNPRVHHVSHAGLMQFTFGFPSMGIQPGDLPPPGDVTLPSPVESMRDNFGVTDCFHLRPEGYDVLIQNLFDNYFSNRFDSIFESGFEG